LTFVINLHKKDKALLKAIQIFFGGIGYIANSGKEAMRFQVTSIKDIEIIIDHFSKYSLITQKWSDFQVLKMAFYSIKK